MDIYVSNLSFQVDDAALRQAFEAFGDVRKATVVKDRETGKSRGFGFVEMPDPEAATRAISALHSQPLMGRTVNVTEARPRPPGGAPERRPPGTSNFPSSSSSAGQGGGGFSGGGSSFSGAPRPAAAPFSGAPRFPSRPPGDRPRDDGNDDRERSSGASDSSDEADEQRRRQARAAAARQHGPNAKAKKVGRFEEGRRLKVLKGNGDGRWRPNLNIVTNEDEDDAEP